MSNEILAGIVVAAHFAWILFLILGLPVLAYLNMRRMRIFHLASLAGTAFMQATGTVCPLTYLESVLRSGRQGSASPGQFITESLESLIYVDEPTLKTVQALTIVLFAATILSFFFRPLRKKARPDRR